MLEKVEDFDFDIFTINRETNGNEMRVLTSFLFQKERLFEKLIIDPVTFDNFFKRIQNGYVDVAYHNKTHGMDVGRLAYYYSTTCEMMRKANLSEFDLAALIIGGSCHDYEHQGWNNAYLIETQHEWAVRYNDTSVCENHHIAASFKIMLENKD